MTTPSTYTATVAKHPRIEGVKTKSLRLIPDERGWLLEILRADDRELFTKFGQVYLSATYPGVVKAWHYHREQVDNFACIVGMVKLVLVDMRPESPTHGVINEFFVGTQNPMLVQVPKLVYHGWKCIGAETALVINVPTLGVRAATVAMTPGLPARTDCATLTDPFPALANPTRI